jgi:hypothetical protein
MPVLKVTRNKYSHLPTITDKYSTAWDALKTKAAGGAAAP